MRAPQIDQIWNIENLITKATAVNCGALSVEFFNDDSGMTTLDSVIFLDDRTTSDSFNLASLYTELVDKKGKYPITYRVYHTLYRANVVTLTNPFTIIIADPCEAPVSVTASILTDQQYTITDNSAVPYVFPVFTANPAWCAIKYNYTITDLSGDAILTFNGDPTVRKFSFYYSADLSLCGASSKKYIVTVIGTSGEVVKVSG